MNLTASHRPGRPSFKQRHESRLLEVLVAGQDFRNAFSLHDDKRNVVGQRLFLVGTRVIQIDAVL